MRHALHIGTPGTGARRLRLAALTLALPLILGLSLLAGQATAAPMAQQAAPAALWNPIGTYGLSFTCTAGCGGTYLHTMSITSFDPDTGSFSGNGHSNDDPSVMWNVTGTLTGNAIAFHVLYVTGNPGYYSDEVGTIAPNGSMSGTGGNNDQAFTWMTTSGAASAGAGYGASQLNSANCPLTKQSKSVVNVSFRMINDYDSAVGGNAWANDTVHRELRIWQITPGTYCATVTDTAKFVTFAGASPQGTGTVTAGIPGSIRGGYITGQFAGTLNPSPPYPTSGNIGIANTFDLMCTDAYTCPGARPTIGSYISGYAGQLQWWGWQYVTQTHGIWVNSQDGNTGDITG